MRKASLALALATGLCACGGTQALDSQIASPQGHSLISALGQSGSLIAGLDAVAAKVNQGVQTGLKDLQAICYVVPWADTALDLFGPLAGVDQGIISETDSAVAAFVGGPCKLPPANFAQAIGQGLGIYKTISTNLQNGGVPIAGVTVK